MRSAPRRTVPTGRRPRARCGRSRWRRPHAARNPARDPPRAPVTRTNAVSARLRGRIPACGDRALRPGDVVPGAVLPSDAAVDPDRFESHGTVQAFARGVRQCRAGDRGAEAALGEAGEQRVVQQAAAAGAPPTALDVDADLARPPV